MQFEITRKHFPDILIWVVWAALLYMSITLTVGSFAEMEPSAGQIFGVITVLVVIAGPVIYFWRKKAHAKG